MAFRPQELIARAGYEMRKAYFDTELAERLWFTISYAEALVLYHGMIDDYNRRVEYARVTYTDALDILNMDSKLETFSAERPPSAPPEKGYWGKIYGVNVNVSG